MATAKDNDLDDFDSVETSGSSGIDLEPGEAVTGEITEANLSAGENGFIRIDGAMLWLNSTMRQQIEAALVNGTEVAHLKSEDEESFESDDGKVTYHPRELRFKNND